MKRLPIARLVSDTMPDPETGVDAAPMTEQPLPARYGSVCDGSASGRTRPGAKSRGKPASFEDLEIALKSLGRSR
jgi:hypothetical protein